MLTFCPYDGGYFGCVKNKVDQCNNLEGRQEMGKIKVRGTRENCKIELKGHIPYYKKINFSDSFKTTCKGPVEIISKSTILLKDLRKSDLSKRGDFIELKEYCEGELLDLQYQKLMGYDPQYLSQKAIEKEDPKICTEAGYEKYMSICLRTYLQKNPSIKICNSFGEEKFGDHSIKDICITELAIINQDPSLCDLEVYSGACYHKLAIELKEESLCEKTWDYLQDECFTDVAVMTNNDFLCEKTTHWRSKCYTLLAAKNLEEFYCDKIKPDEKFKYKVKCFQYVEELKNNPKSCLYSASLYIREMNCDTPHPYYGSDRIV